MPYPYTFKLPSMVSPFSTLSSLSFQLTKPAANTHKIHQMECPNDDNWQPSHVGFTKSTSNFNGNTNSHLLPLRFVFKISMSTNSLKLHFPSQNPFISDHYSIWDVQGPIKSIQSAHGPKQLHRQPKP